MLLSIYIIYYLFIKVQIKNVYLLPIVFFVFKYAIWFENIMLIVVVIFSTQQFFCFHAAMTQLCLSSHILLWHANIPPALFLIRNPFIRLQTQHQTNTAAATFL